MLVSVITETDDIHTILFYHVQLTSSIKKKLTFSSQTKAPRNNNKRAGVAVCVRIYV
jgi:hypothetical protein